MTISKFSWFCWQLCFCISCNISTDPTYGNNKGTWCKLQLINYNKTYSPKEKVPLLYLSSLFLLIFGGQLRCSLWCWLRGSCASSSLLMLRRFSFFGRQYWCCLTPVLAQRWLFSFLAHLASSEGFIFFIGFSVETLFFVFSAMVFIATDATYWVLALALFPNNNCCCCRNHKHINPCAAWNYIPEKKKKNPTWHC